MQTQFPAPPPPKRDKSKPWIVLGVVVAVIGGAALLNSSFNDSKTEKVSSNEYSPDVPTVNPPIVEEEQCMDRSAVIAENMEAMDDLDSVVQCGRAMDLACVNDYTGRAADHMHKVATMMEPEPEAAMYYDMAASEMDEAVLDTYDIYDMPKATEHIKSAGEYVQMATNASDTGTAPEC